MFKNKKLVITISLLIILIFILVVSLLTNGTFNLENNTDYAVLNINDKSIVLEIADEPHEQSIGLMNRGKISEGSVPNSNGMLFIFENETPKTFWMKNTYISLDIIFLDSQKRVLNIDKNTKTNQVDEVYSSNGNSMYVIELEGGKSDELGIDVGDIIDFNYTPNTST